MAKRKTKHQRNEERENASKAISGSGNSLPAVQSGSFRFAAAFSLTCIILYAIIFSIPDSLTRPLNEFVAATLGMTLNFFGVPASVTGQIVSEKSLAFEIIPECTPLSPSVLFVSLIFFYPASYRQKVVGLAMGLPALYLGNLLRLSATFLVSRYDRRLFEVFHVYLGQVFTMFLVILICMLWLRWIDSEESRQGFAATAAGFLARFALISGCLFLVWMKVHHGYIWLLDQFMHLGFSLFNQSVSLSRNTPVYYETFSIVVFASLVLAARSFSMKMKIQSLAAGLGFLFIVHLFHRVDNALMAYFHFTAAQSLDLTLLIIGQYLLPLLFLIYLVQHQKRDFPQGGT